MSPIARCTLPEALGCYSGTGYAVAGSECATNWRVVAAALFFLFQGEVLIAIFLGAPSIIIIGGLLWLTHNLFVEAKP
jgi:hypothetical protein